MLVKSGFSRFAEDSFGHTMQPSECISLLRCARNTNPRLWGLNVVDASLGSEIQLLCARVGAETNFMLIYASVNSKLQLPSSVKIELWKLVPPGPKLCSNALTKFIFFLERKTQWPWLSTHLPSFKTLGLADLYLCNPVERIDISGSNSPPQPRKVQISYFSGTDDSKIRVGCPGEGNVKASNWSMQFFYRCIIPLSCFRSFTCSPFLKTSVSGVSICY